MTTSIYKLSSKKIPGGAIYLSYRLGSFGALDLADAMPTTDQLRYLLDVLPLTEEELASVNLGTMAVDKVPERTAKDKIKWFCAAYREYRGLSYQPTQNEASNIRTVPVTQGLLTVFFETPAMTDFTIRNYIGRINITRDVLKNGREPVLRFPNHYDKELYHKLPADKLLAYKKHLVARGWKQDSVRGWVLRESL